MTNEQKTIFDEVRSTMQELKVCRGLNIQLNEQQEKTILTACGLPYGRIGSCSLFGDLQITAYSRKWSGDTYLFNTSTKTKSHKETEYGKNVFMPIDGELLDTCISVFREMINDRKAQILRLAQQPAFDTIKAEMYDFMRDFVANNCEGVAANVAVGRLGYETNCDPYESMVFDLANDESYHGYLGLVKIWHSEHGDLFYSACAPLRGQCGGKLEYDNYKDELTNCMKSLLHRYMKAA